MSIIPLLAILVVVVSSVSGNSHPKIVREDLHYNSPHLIEYINGLGTTWRAGYNLRFRETSHDVIKGMLGVNPFHIGAYRHTQAPEPHSNHRPHHHQYTHAHHRRSHHHPRMHLHTRNQHLRAPIPASFDARTQWPRCSSLREVRDQSACGSCWAFGAVEAMSDRICIASSGRLQVDLSADDLLSCCHSCGFGCDGGEPLAAWQYWVDHGIVTGSNFTYKHGCRPYPFPPCEHHSNHTHFPACHHQLYPTPNCEQQCQASYSKPYAQDKHYGSRAYSVENSVEAIQREIMKYGPVEAAFEVYEDFLHYVDGVYQHHAGKLDGGHAVKIIGWGEENNTAYWLVANSWNYDWGINGFFKILRGSNECGIEDGIVAGTPRLNWNRNVFRQQYS